MSQNEVEKLIQKAKESLNAARQLLRGDYNDFAASRAYYAMFYVAEALLLAIGQSYSKHSAVISAFAREYARTEVIDAKFHRWLIDAQDLRNIGDYGVGVHVDRVKAEAVCMWAEEFIIAAGKHLSKRSDEDAWRK